MKFTYGIASYIYISFKYIYIYAYIEMKVHRSQGLIVFHQATCSTQTRGQATGNEYEIAASSSLLSLSSSEAAAALAMVRTAKSNIPDNYIS